jgi:hypothetical protein
MPPHGLLHARHPHLPRNPSTPPDLHLNANSICLCPHPVLGGPKWRLVTTPARRRALAQSFMLAAVVLSMLSIGAVWWLGDFGAECKRYCDDATLMEASRESGYTKALRRLQLARSFWAPRHGCCKVRSERP